MSETRVSGGILTGDPQFELLTSQLLIKIGIVNIRPQTDLLRVGPMYSPVQ